MSKKQTVELVAFIDGEQVSSTGKYDLQVASEDEFLDISNEISTRLMEACEFYIDDYEDETYLDERGEDSIFPEDKVGQWLDD